jgi:hypothetical protein
MLEAKCVAIRNLHVIDIRAVRTDSNFGMLRLEISDACLPFHFGKICDRPRTSKLNCPIREFSQVTLRLRIAEFNRKKVTFLDVTQVL